MTILHVGRNGNKNSFGRVLDNHGISAQVSLEDGTGTAGCGIAGAADLVVRTSGARVGGDPRLNTSL